jgi:hypothetical protein
MSMTHPPEKSDPVTRKELGQYKVEIALILIAAIMSAVISVAVFSYQSYQTQKSEQRSIAIGYLMEIENIGPPLVRFIAFNASMNETDFRPAVPMDNFYPAYGLYYSNRADISKFDSETSASLYRFYYHLLRADDQRKMFADFDTVYAVGSGNPGDPAANGTLKREIYLHMVDDLNQSVTEIPRLKLQLQNYAAG